MSLKRDSLIENSEYLRIKVLDTLIHSRNGHLGACLGAAELFSVLYGCDHFHLNPDCVARDRILVRGHLGPLRYSLFSEFGWVTSESLKTYRKLDSALQGHEDMALVKGVDITPSGCLGNLLAYGVGSALALRRHPSRCATRHPMSIVFLGDGEEQEGAVSEAARLAGKLAITNLLCVLDANGGQLTGTTAEIGGEPELKTTWQGYGWDVLEIDGHDVCEIESAYDAAVSNSNEPLLVIARTQKGRGAIDADKSPNGYHTLSSVGGNSTERIEFLQSCKLKLLNDWGDVAPKFNMPKRIVTPACPNKSPKVRSRLDWRAKPKNALTLVEAWDDCLVETSLAYPEAKFVVFNADTFSQRRLDYYRESKNIEFIQCGLREQAMLGAAHGLACASPDTQVFIDVAEPFLVRAYDQLVAMAQAKLPVTLLMCYSGLCGNENGATHQPSFFSQALQAVPNLRLLEPSHPADMQKCLNGCRSQVGPTVLRMHSEKRSSSEPPTEAQAGSPFIRFKCEASNRNAEVVILAAGLMVEPALDAQAKLAKLKIDSHVIKVLEVGVNLDDLTEQLLTQARLVVLIYNGSPDSLDKSVRFTMERGRAVHRQKILRLGFRIGTSGTNAELLEHFGLNGDNIVMRIQEEVIGLRSLSGEAHG